MSATGDMKARAIALLEELTADQFDVSIEHSPTHRLNLWRVEFRLPSYEWKGSGETLYEAVLEAGERAKRDRAAGLYQGGRRG